MDEIINAEARGKEVFIMISHPSKRKLDIYDAYKNYSFANSFWECVAETWNRDYSSYMRMQILERAELGVCNEDESIQFRPLYTENWVGFMSKSLVIKFRNGKLSILNLKRFAKCISKSIQKLTDDDTWEVKFNRKYLNKTYEYNIDEEQLIDAENRYEDIIIKVSHPTEKNLGIHEEQTEESCAIKFWERVAKTWNKVYSSTMTMERINCSEPGIWNSDQSVQFRPIGGNKIKFRNGKLSLLDLRRITRCISKSIKKLKRRNDFKVELRFITQCSESEDSPNI
jgi:hypothetical protein